MPDIWDRIHDRIIRNERKRLVALPLSTFASYTPKAAKPKKSAKAEWRERVDAIVASGMSKPQAVMQVDRENPGLRQRMLDEVNSR